MTVYEGDPKRNLCWALKVGGQSTVDYATTAGAAVTVPSLVMGRQATAVSALALTTVSIVGVTNTAAKRTITLPSSQVAVPGRVYWVSDESAGAAATNVIDVVGEGGELIDGVATFAMYGGEIVGFYATGTVWRAGI